MTYYIDACGWEKLQLKILLNHIFIFKIFTKIQDINIAFMISCHSSTQKKKR